MNEGADGKGLPHRLIAVLRLFAEGGETLSINEISERLQIAPSSVHRLLAVLVEENIVERAAKRRYCLGLEFGRIGALAARRIDIRRLARPMLQHMVASTGESAMLGVLLPRSQELMIADKMETVHAFRLKINLHTRRPLIWGAQGLAVLAWLDADEVESVLAASPPSLITENRPPSPADLERTLRTIRKGGYALTRGQVVAGAVGIAAPVFNAEENVVGDLSLSIPEIRFRRFDQKKLVKLVVAEAGKLSISLGARELVPQQTNRSFFG